MTVLTAFSVPPVSKVSLSVAPVPTFRLMVAVPVPAPRLRVVRLLIALPTPLSRESVEPPPTTTEVIWPGFVISPVSANVEFPVALRPVAADTVPATVNVPPSLAMRPLLPTGTEAVKVALVLPSLTMSSLPSPVFSMA